MLAAVLALGTVPVEATDFEKITEIKDDMLQQALYIIPEGFSDIDFLAPNASYTSPETVTVEEAQARLQGFIEKFNGKFFTVDGNYCQASGVHASACGNCLMSNVIAAEWVENLVGMGKLDASLCPTQYSYKGVQGYSDGYQCFGFANFAHWYIFAQKNTDKVISTLEATGPLTYETIKNALPGDVLRSNYYGGHSMIFISCDEEGFNVIDSNHTGNADGKSACIVKVHKVKYNPKYTVAITGVKNYERTAECEHEYSEEVTPPTCTEQGYTTHTCTICGESCVDTYTEPTGHSFGEWVTVNEATFTEDGTESRTCVKCSHVEFRSVPLTVVTSGNVGYGTPYTDDVIYTLYSNGTMVISGNGIVYCSDWRGDYQPYKDYRAQVKTLIIEEGISATRGGCFAHFYNLETVTLPDSLTKIDGNAFMSSFSSSVTSIVIPETVTFIGSYCYGFYYGNGGTTFTDVIIENPNVILPANNTAFNAGSNLENLTLYSYGTDNNVSAYAEKYGCKYVDLEVYKTGEFEGINYAYYDGVLTLSTEGKNMSIPSDAPWNEYKSKITKIEIESGIIGISANAFADYAVLEKVELPDSIKSIGNCAFSVSESCSKEISMVIPRRIDTVGKNIFENRSNVKVTAYLGSPAAEIDEPGVELTVKKKFKFLMIGNSYTEDASSCGQGMTESQLFNIIQAMLGEDTEIVLGAITSGGKGINWHATKAEENTGSYSFKIVTSENRKWKSMGSISSAKALAYTDWDAVSLQVYNVNVNTGEESVSYPEQTDPKFYKLEDASEFMLDHIAKHAPYADAYFYMHWSQTSSIALNAALSGYNRLANYIPIVLDYEGTESGKKFEDIVPVGLSVQNARTTYLALLAYNTTAYADGNLNLTTDAQIGLQRDGGHLSFNIGRYIAGLTFAEMVIPKEIREEGYVLPDIRITESIGKLPEEYTEIAQKSVFAAVESWKNGSLEVTEIEGYEVDPVDTESAKLAEVKIAVPYAADDESLKARITEAVFAALAEDFYVESVEFAEGFKIEGEGQEFEAEIEIRFGYMYKTVSVSVKIEESLMGDLNLDGSVDVKDAYYARLVAAKLRTPTEQQILLGDVDLDGKITAIDANIIRKYALGIITEIPVE